LQASLPCKVLKTHYLQSASIAPTLIRELQSGLKAYSNHTRNDNKMRPLSAATTKA